MWAIRIVKNQAFEKCSPHVHNLAAALIAKNAECLEQA